MYQALARIGQTGPLHSGIAAALYVSETTVKTHVQHIRAKLG